MRVVITQPIHDEAISRLTAEPGLDVVGPLASGPLDPAELARRAAGSDILLTQLTDTIGPAILEDTTLRLVANVAVGVDNIALDTASSRGVAVTNTPGVLTAATADLTVALILAAARRIPEADALVRSGGFEGWRLIQEPMGVDVTGATLGVIGMGRIGTAVARRCHHGFDMTILYTGGGSELGSGDAIEAHALPLDELLARADFVSLHAPLSPATHHLVDGRALGLMRRSAILVNTARGALVDEAALVGALDAGWIGGAALDVFEDEPRIHPGLIGHRERVVLSPHLGSATDSTRRKMSAMAVDNVLAFAAGRLPPNLVTGASRVTPADAEALER